ncbi:uncharacterized protein LOC124139486 [Haliotis rufescens]|uniref:uncharacterized protein LOC124139486 n=1 Tax=Haliotis rufescens TaxID=6454 RepID=UPI001EB01934|nr:uncharacterized protein LOC124139486 [Haliotis rufescens]
MGNSAPTLIGNQTTQCVKVQRSAAAKLQSLSEFIREQQKDANIAKATFGSTGIVGTGMVLAGTALATGRLSTAIIAVGVTAGIASGAGEIAVSWFESEEMKKRIKEVQDILDKLKEETQGLIEALRRNKKYRYVPDYDTLVRNKTKLDYTKKCGRHATRALSVINATLRVQWMAIGLKPEAVCIKDIAKFRRGISALRKVKAGKVIKSAGVAVAGISLAIDIKDVLKNLSDVKGNVSEVADVVEKMAEILGAV